MKDLKVPDYLLRRSNGTGEGDEDDVYDEGSDYSDIEDESDEEEEEVVDEGHERLLRMKAPPLPASNDDDDDDTSELTQVRVVRVDIPGLEEEEGAHPDIVGGAQSKRGANGLSVARLVHIDLESKQREAAIEAEALAKGKDKDSALLTTVRAAKVDIAGEEKKKAGALTLCKGTNKGDIVPAGKIAGKNLECDTDDDNLDYKDCYLGELENLIS